MRKLLVLDFDGTHGITRGRLVDRGYGHHVSPSPENFLSGTVNDNYAADAWHFFRRAGVDAGDLGMSMRTLHAVRIKHARTNKIVSVLGSSGGLHRTIHAAHALADKLSLTRVRPLIFGHGYAPPFC